MRCLNSECGSLVADELNVSVNLSFTFEVADVEYTGETDYMDPLVPIGTWCSDCQQRTLMSGWIDSIRALVEGDQP